jgi:hypothetical protein
MFGAVLTAMRQAKAAEQNERILAHRGPISAGH